MTKIYLCTPHKLGDLNFELIKRIKKLGFEVLCAATDTPQNLPFEEIFDLNVDLIKKADVFVAVLKDYGKDLTAEVGMAYVLGIPRIGIDFNAKKEDIMTYYAFDKIIKEEELEEVLSQLKIERKNNKLSQIAEEANEIENEIGLTMDDSLNKLTQELGEFNDAVQKFRGRYCKTKTENKDNIKEEVGDLIFNIISICNKLGINPDEVPELASITLSKFKERKDIYKKNLK